MKEIEVKGQKRTDLGKKAAKAMRKEGLIPCNLYGEAKNADGAPEALSIACPMSELRKIVYTPHIYVIKLVIDGEERTAILKELQFHPVTGCTRRWTYEPLYPQDRRYSEIPVYP